MSLKKKLNLFSSFKTRLTLFNSLILVGAMITTVAVLFYSYKKVTDLEVKKNLTNQVKLLTRIIDEDNDEFKLAKELGHTEEEVDLEEDLEGINELVWIQRQGHTKLFRSPNARNKRMPIFNTGLKVNTTSFKADAINKETPLIQLHYLYRDKEGQIYHIIIAKSLKNVYWATKRFLATLLVWIPIISILSSIIIYFISKQGLKPLDKIVQEAEKIKEAENFQSIDLPQKGPIEIQKLTESLKQMLFRLETSFEREKQFSAAASHELNTPLTALKGSIEVALTRERTSSEYQLLLTESLNEVNHLIAIIKNLLLLAKLDARKNKPQETETFNLTQLIEEVQEQTQILLEAENQSTKVETKTDRQIPLTIQGNYRLLNQALYNLTSNAAKHAKADLIEVEAKRNNGTISVTIKDNGKGISTTDLPHLFNRFYRTDKSRNSKGYGLGLSLVQSIVLSHNGTISVESTEGKGTVFNLTFPAKDE